MKKLLSLLLAVLLMLSSCKNTYGDAIESEQMTERESVTDTESVTETEPEATATPETAECSSRAEELKALLRENFPITDGSTSAIPLDAAIRAAIFDIPYEEAEVKVKHTTSHISFDNLLRKRCDFVFCHLLSPEQYRNAQYYGIKVEQIPIAREGFVFIVSRDNPVDSLTVEQIKGIYSGKITNWKDVGGDDVPIVAYQRNIDSGSQNYMRAFMGDTPLMDAPTELRPGNMDSIIDVIASYKTSSASIGYSVYSYVEGMYNAGGRVKALKVNGIAPGYDTIYDGTYPCTGYNYIVFRADEPEGSPARNLAEWILTTEGQKVIASTGYFAPLEPIPGVKPTITGLQLYTEKGTGDRTADFCSYYYTVDVPTAPLEIGFEDGYKVGVRKYTFDRRRPVTGNAALDAEVEKYLIDTTKRMTELEYDSDINDWDPMPSISISFKFIIVNGYLSVTCSRGWNYEIGAMWDIGTGKRLVLSDLFENGADFVYAINERIESYIAGSGNFFDEHIETIRPFSGIESDFNNFALSSDYIHLYNSWDMRFELLFNPGDNSYFSNPQAISITVRDLPKCLLTSARDMSAYFNNQYRNYWPNYNKELRNAELTDIYKTDDEFKLYAELRWYDITGYPGADKINAAQYDYLSKNYDPLELAWSDEAISVAIDYMRDILLGNYGIKNPTREDLRTCRVLIEAEPFFFGDRYVAISYFARAEYDDTIGYGGGVVSGRHLELYDLQTGDPVDISVLFFGGRLKGKIITFDDNWDVKVEDAVITDMPTYITDKRNLQITAGNEITYYKSISMYLDESGDSGRWFVPDDDALIWFK